MSEIQSFVRKRPFWTAAIIFVVLVALAQILPAYFLSRLNFLWIAIISAAGLNLLTGLAGQVSLGQAAFMAIGGYTAAGAYRYFGLDLLISLPLGACLAAIVGFLIGIPSLRLRGFYLALTTLALHFAVAFAANKFQLIAGGTAATGFSIDRAMIGPFRLASDYAWFTVLSAIGLLTLVGFYNLARSKVGRAWTAVRDRDIAAAIIGVDVTRYKLMAFVVSSAVAGGAGVLQAYYLGNVAVESFGLELAISYVAIIIVGGMGSVAGTVLGAIVILQLPFFIQWITAVTVGSGASSNFMIFDLQAGVFGVVIIAFLMFEPDGVVGMVHRLTRWLRTNRRTGQPHDPATLVPSSPESEAH
jgi:branched-chain amino acid transport system permease protein